jgi:hypothetical protein
MDYSAGLDVLVKETSVCIVDDAGRIVRIMRGAGRQVGFVVTCRHQPSAPLGPVVPQQRIHALQQTVSFIRSPRRR